VAILKSIATYYVIYAAASQERYADQQVLIKELVELVLHHAPSSLDSFFLDDWRRAGTQAEKLRVVIDQVASLTDPGAYALHVKLKSLR
jgi:dGTPase